MTPTTIRKGDVVRFEKNGAAIRGGITYIAVERIDDDGAVWVRLVLDSTTGHIVKEDDVEIIRYVQHLRRTG